MGNGKVCYGNLMERLLELNTEPGGAWSGQLSAAISLFSQTRSAVGTSQVWTRLTSCVFVLAGSLSWSLQNLGPFTAFVPVNKAFRGTPVRACPRPCPRPVPAPVPSPPLSPGTRSVSLVLVLQVKSLTTDPSKARYLCQLHLVAGVMSLDTLQKSEEFYTLTGKSAELDTSGGVRTGAAVTWQQTGPATPLTPVWSPQDSQLKIRLHGSRKKGVIVQAGIVASNGMIHLINKLMDSVSPIVQSDAQVETHT